MKRNSIKQIIFLATLVLLALLSGKLFAQNWQAIEDGIKFTEIDNAIWVFKIDPEKFNFNIAYRKVITDNSGERMDIRVLPKWGRGINLNMFTHGMTPNGYTKVNGEVIQASMNSYNLFLVWNDNEFKILDRREDDISNLAKYPNVSQNIRMIKGGSGKRNRWQVDEKMWSVSTIGISKTGEVLLINSRKAYTMHDFIDVILEGLPEIDKMAYCEGGPESSIYINEEYNRMGSYETGFWENDNNDIFWELPFAFTFEKK